MADSDDRFSRIRDFYNREYYRDVPEASDRYAPWHYKHVADRLGSMSGKRVLDVACGTGEWLALLAERGAKPAGIDLSERAIDVCRRRFGEENFHVGPAERLPFADASFDLVTCLGSLEHFLEPENALREMARVAKSDARFLLLVPNIDFLPNRLGLYGGTQQMTVREVPRTLDGWRALFATASLRVDERWRDLHVLDRRWIMKDGWLRAPLRAAFALSLPIWPLGWQYQVYHLCRRTTA